MRVYVRNQDVLCSAQCHLKTPRTCFSDSLMLLSLYARGLLASEPAGCNFWRECKSNAEMHTLCTEAGHFLRGRSNSFRTALFWERIFMYMWTPHQHHMAAKRAPNTRAWQQPNVLLPSRLSYSQAHVSAHSVGEALLTDQLQGALPSLGALWITRGLLSLEEWNLLSTQMFKNWTHFVFNSVIS